MHSCIICRPALGPNLKGKLKFTYIIHTHAFTVQHSNHKQVLDFIYSHSLITQHVRPRQRPLRLMPLQTRDADANIFAFTRNTVHIRRHLQRISIQSYHRRRRQSTYHCPQLNAR